MPRNIEEMVRRVSYSNCRAYLFQQQEGRKSCRMVTECSIKGKSEPDLKTIAASSEYIGATKHGRHK
jgi:hypothetical protein